ASTWPRPDRRSHRHTSNLSATLALHRSPDLTYLSLTPRPPRSTLFPYTTLFRSRRDRSSIIAATGVIPIPADTSTSGDSDSPRITSPAGWETSSTVPGVAFSCNQPDTRPSGAPLTPRTRLIATRRLSPRGQEEIVYWHGWRRPSGRSTAIETYWPVS